MNLPYFRFWCQKVLPLVYEDSLSYNEVLCKVVDYLNNLIADNKVMTEDIQQLKSELSEVQKWIDKFNYDEIDKIIAEYIPVSVMFAISDDGYFITYIPSSWKNITFHTTGLDINVKDTDYGHLVLLY